MTTITNDNSVEIQELLCNLGDAISEIDDVDTKESLHYCQNEIWQWLKDNVFLTEPSDLELGCNEPPRNKTVITVTLPIRLDYLCFITQFDDSDNFVVYIKDNVLIIEEVLP